MPQIKTETEYWSIYLVLNGLFFYCLNLKSGPLVLFFDIVDTLVDVYKNVDVISSDGYEAKREGYKKSEED